MLHVLSKKSKSKAQKAQSKTTTTTATVTTEERKWEKVALEMKSSTPDFRSHRKFRCGKEGSSVRILGGSMRTRSNSSRRSCSAMVTFESIKPTQVWQASASPSPPPSHLVLPPLAPSKHPKQSKMKHQTESLAVSMISQAPKDNHWLSLSTGDEDDLSDSSDEDDVDDDDLEGRRSDVDRRKRPSTSNSRMARSSLSSSDSSFELARTPNKSSRHRRKKHQSSRRNRRENISFSSGSSTSSSESSSSSSSSEDENEFDLCWKLKADGSLRNPAVIQTTPQLKRPQVIMVTPMSTPQVVPRYPSSKHHFNRPQTLHIPGTPFNRPMSSGISSKEAPFVQSIARAVEDFFPTLEWIDKYKVIGVHRGDMLRIIPYPGTNTDKFPSSNGWFLAQKLCSDHGTGTGPIGFVPRIVCSFVCSESTPRVTHISPRHTRSQDYSIKRPEAAMFMQKTSEGIPSTSSGPMSVASTICDTASEPIPTRGMYPSPQLSLHTPPSNSTVKNSFTSIPAVYEIEDRDSGRGPSSGSEWSSGKGGSLSGATDINVDEKDHPPAPQSSQIHQQVPSSSLKWSPTTSYQRRASLDQQSPVNFACPLPPPPMALLSHVCVDALGVKKPSHAIATSPNPMSVSDTEVNGSISSTPGARSRLYVRGTPQTETKPEADRESGGTFPVSEGNRGREEGEEDEGATSGSPQSTVVVVSSNSDPAHWEPYKTMIQVGQNKLEKFTLV